MSDNGLITTDVCPDCGAEWDQDDPRWTVEFQSVGELWDHDCDPDVARAWKRKLALEKYEAEVARLNRVAIQDRRNFSNGMQFCYDVLHNTLRTLRTDADCPACAGTGQLLSHECSRCDGAGEVVHGD